MPFSGSFSTKNSTPLLFCWKVRKTATTKPITAAMAISGITGLPTMAWMIQPNQLRR